MKRRRNLGVWVWVAAASVAGWLAVSETRAQATQANDPFAGKKAAAKTGEKDEEKQLGFLIEYIELDHRRANQLIREHGQNTTDATPLRDGMEDLLDAGEASLLETQWTICRSGNRCKIESVHELIYPKEMDPPKIADKLTLNQVDTGNYLGTPATPTAFETRNVGTTTEIDPVLGADGETIDINLAPELVEYLGERNIGRPGADATMEEKVTPLTMPEFYAMKVTTALTVKSGKYAMIGMLTPKERADRRIFVFIRVTVIGVR